MSYVICPLNIRNTTSQKVLNTTKIIPMATMKSVLKKKIPQKILNVILNIPTNM